MTTPGKLLTRVVPTVLAWALSASLLHATDATPTATYRLTFEATWSATTHPVDFPSNPHFSGLVGGVHGAEAVFWVPGGEASPGIERMAEQGSKDPLRDEVQAAIDLGLAASIVNGPGVGTSPGTAEVELTVTQEFPLVTVVSMVAPSPDWFVGVSSLSLFSGEDWVESLSIELSGWDAGTDSGPTFESPNDDTQPREPITQIVVGPLAGTPPLGRFVFTRLDVPEPPPPEGPLLLREGRFAVTADWENRNGRVGTAKPLLLTRDTGALWFFSASNLELVVKVVDACRDFGRYWFFAAGLTNVQVDLTVTDTQTGQEERYQNALGTPFLPIQDTTSFAMCP